MTHPLAGKRVIVTRERPGELAVLLEARGAEVVHVPLIAIGEPLDGGAELAADLSRLDDFDWLVVTSVPGAERVGPAAAACESVRLACVGATTASRLASLAGRVVEVVPDTQRAAALAELLIEIVGPERSRFLVAQADRASSLLVDRLRSAGHDVTSRVAYRTSLVRPDPEQLADADALLLTSGSAAQSWVEAVGASGPPVVVAIGPTTAGIADKMGLKVTSVAADHSLAGLVDELERRLAT